jgi:hypothetical protein
MKIILSLAAMVTVLAVATSANAKGLGGGAPASTPGQQFRSSGPVNTGPTAGPGASGYAPGQISRENMNNGTHTGPGASVYAPGFMK